MKVRFRRARARLGLVILVGVGATLMLAAPAAQADPCSVLDLGCVVEETTEVVEGIVGGVVEDTTDAVEPILEEIEDVTDPILDPVDEIVDETIGTVEEIVDGVVGGVVGGVPDVPTPPVASGDAGDGFLAPVAAGSTDAPVATDGSPDAGRVTGGSASERAAATSTGGTEALRAFRAATPLRSTALVSSLTVGGSDAAPAAFRSPGDEGVLGAVERVAKAMAFPLALAFVVAAFVLGQNRLDRRDPKLATAPVGPDVLGFV